jgi:hypothetical protein
VEQHGVLYSAAYEDGDLRVVLYRSTDDENWTAGPEIYGVAADTPLEAELIFSPSGRRMLALVRMDGNDFELFGNRGRLRTKVCWAERPYDSFTCPQELDGVRLDGPVAFWWKKRLFVIARKHLPGDQIRKRTALYEITGNLEGGPIGIVEWGELPSAGDTSYAGIARIGGPRFLATWYSSPLAGDPSWITGFFGQTDIWQAELDLSRLPEPPGKATAARARTSRPGAGCPLDQCEERERSLGSRARPTMIAVASIAEPSASRGKSRIFQTTATTSPAAVASRMVITRRPVISSQYMFVSRPQSVKQEADSDPDEPAIEEGILLFVAVFSAGAGVKGPEECDHRSGERDERRLCRIRKCGGDGPTLRGRDSRVAR